MTERIELLFMEREAHRELVTMIAEATAQLRALSDPTPDADAKLIRCSALALVTRVAARVGAMQEMTLSFGDQT